MTQSLNDSILSHTCPPRTNLRRADRARAGRERPCRRLPRRFPTRPPPRLPPPPSPPPSPQSPEVRHGPAFQSTLPCTSFFFVQTTRTSSPFSKVTVARSGGRNIRRAATAAFSS